MKPRSTSLLVAAVVAGLALGSAGTSVAAPALSKGAVKKIATKVLKKAAPSLSVASAASAASAANADRLDGLDSADLKTTTHRLTFFVASDALTQTQAFPGVPAGTYLVTYDAVLSTLVPVSCAMIPSSATPSVVVARSGSAPTGAGVSTVSGSAVMAFVGSQSSFQCTSAALFHITSGEITFTKVDAVTQGAALPVV